MSEIFKTSKGTVVFQSDKKNIILNSSHISLPDKEL